ncbi:hypothetical protein RFI_09068 [Reticulomyxa filosa]|uniref:Uncharacterized protein n=1 Tax=Reticulomyxa filosa TaxID=46433 RepID=X6NRV0_RETFI|nr:hypothetical protein RFI_09068 [Reticulomyxa filosa]|eukprot:ETO28067.1 hypothetical protein RFI_09068 [Reticulomyxa filosa]
MDWAVVATRTTTIRTVTNIRMLRVTLIRTRTVDIRTDPTRTNMITSILMTSCVSKGKREKGGGVCCSFIYVGYGFDVIYIFFLFIVVVFFFLVLCLHSSGKGKGTKGDQRNINVRSAFIHVLGDLVQSIGVVIAAALIWADHKLRLLDPICTLIFSIIVVFTTTTLVRDALDVLMENVPKHINLDKLTQTLKELPDVADVHDLHVWNLSVGKPALSVHLLAKSSTYDSDGKIIPACADGILRKAQKICSEEFHIQHSTIQIEYPRGHHTKIKESSCPPYCADGRKDSDAGIKIDYMQMFDFFEIERVKQKTKSKRTELKKKVMCATGLFCCFKLFVSSGDHLLFFVRLKSQYNYVQLLTQIFDVNDVKTSMGITLQILLIIVVFDALTNNFQRQFLIMFSAKCNTKKYSFEF